VVHDIQSGELRGKIQLAKLLSIWKIYMDPLLQESEFTWMKIQLLELVTRLLPHNGKDKEQFRPEERMDLDLQEAW